MREMQFNQKLIDKINKKFDSIIFTHKNQNVSQPLVCVTCDTLIFGDNVQKITVQQILLYKNQLKPQNFTNTNTTINRNYNVNIVNQKIKKKLQDMMLSPRATYFTNCNDARVKKGFSICNCCYEKLKQSKVPTYAICNNFNFGTPPKCLTCLTEIEIAFITPIKTHGFCFSFTGGRQRQLKGSLSYFKIEPSSIKTVVSKLNKLGINKHVIVLFYGDMTHQQYQKAKTKAEIRIQEITTAMKWLCEHNINWKMAGIKFTTESVNAKPIIINSSKIIEGNQTLVESEEEFQIFFPDGTVTNISAEQTNVTHIQELINKATETNNKIALQCNFSLKSVNETEDNALVQACLLQFPYGYGGPYDYRLNSNNTQCTNHFDIYQYIKHLSLISQPHFHHNLFVLILYNLHIKHTMVRNTFWRVRSKIDAATIATDLTLDDVKNAIAKKGRKTASKTNKNLKGSKFISCIDAIAGKIPHTNEAAKTARKTAEAMQHHLGCPSYFLTVTPDDDNSYLLQVFANKIIDTNEPLHTLSDDTLYQRAILRTELRLKYPGLCALQFEIILKIIIENVLGWDLENQEYNKASIDTLFGSIDGYAISVEEQGRKTLHAHILVWVTEHKTKIENIHSKNKLIREKAEKELIQQFDLVSSCKLIGTPHDTEKALCEYLPHGNCNHQCNMTFVNNDNLRFLRYRFSEREQHPFIICMDCNTKFSAESLMQSHLIKKLKVKKLTAFPDYSVRRLKSYAVDYQKPFNKDTPHAAIIDAAYNFHVHSASCFKNNTADLPYIEKKN